MQYFQNLYNNELLCRVLKSTSYFETTLAPERLIFLTCFDIKHNTVLLALTAISALSVELFYYYRERSNAFTRCVKIVISIAINSYTKMKRKNIEKSFFVF